MFHSPETRLKNSTRLFAGVVQYITILKSGHDDRLAQIGIKFCLIVIYFQKKVPTFKILNWSRQKTQIRAVPNMYNKHIKITKRRGGWFQFDPRVIFYPFFFPFLRSFIHFFTPFLNNFIFFILFYSF